MNSTTVVSLCLILDRLDSQSARDIDSWMRNNFKYYEIIVIASASSAGGPAEKNAKILGNSRFVVVNIESNKELLYKTLLELAIGDVVILFDPQESHVEEINVLVSGVQNGNDYAVIAYQKKGLDLYACMSAFFYKILSLLCGLHFDSRISNTCAFSRSTVNCINSLPSGWAKLRLLLASGRFSGILLFQARRRARTLSYVMQQISGAVEILGSAPFRLLKLCAAISMSACLMCLLYFIYAVLIWIFKTDVQPGWLTTSVFQSVFFGLLFFAFFLFSCISSANAGREACKTMMITRDEHGNRLIHDLDEINVTDRQ